MKKEDIANALKARLESAGLKYPIAYPNVNFDGRAPYILWQWAASTRENGFVLGDDALFERGRVSISVVWTYGAGEVAPNGVATAIAELFPDDLRIDIPDGQIRISEPADVVGGYRDGPVWRVPVTIKYEARRI